MELLDQIEFWHWWVLAGVLSVLELAAPMHFFLWVGIAAVAVGFLVLALGSISLQVQLAVFGALCIIAILAWRRFRATRVSEPEE